MSIFFKQYGEQRTGTNYLKRIIELNFTDAVVFASVLGWKHGLYEWANDYATSCASHADWLDHQHRDGVVYSVDKHPLPYKYEWLRASLNSLHYVISIRDLPDWIWSYRHFRHKASPWNSAQVHDWCERYLNNYQRWACLLEDHGGVLIRYESLVHDAKSVLNLLEARFALRRAACVFRDEPFVVSASTDLGLLVSATAKFNLESLSNGLRVLPDSVLQIVQRYTDRAQALMARMDAFSLGPNACTKL